MLPVTVCPNVKVSHLPSDSIPLRLKSAQGASSLTTPIPEITKSLQEMRTNLASVFFRKKFTLFTVQPLEKIFERESLIYFWDYIGALELLLPYQLSSEKKASFTFSVEDQPFQYDTLLVDYALVCCALANVYERYATKDAKNLHSQEYFLMFSGIVLRRMATQIKTLGLSHALPPSSVDLDLATAQSELQRTRVNELLWFGRHEGDIEPYSPEQKLDLFDYLEIRYIHVLKGFKEAKSGKLLKQQIQAHLKPLLGDVHLDMCESVKIVDQETYELVKAHLAKVPELKQFEARITDVKEKLMTYESQPLLLYDEVSNRDKPDHNFNFPQDEVDDEPEPEEPLLVELEKKVTEKTEEYIEEGKERFRAKHKDELVLLEGEHRLQPIKRTLDRSVSTFTLCSQLISEVRNQAEKGVLAGDVANDIEVLIQKIGEIHRHECNLAAVFGRLLEQNGIAGTLTDIAADANTQREAGLQLLKEDLARRVIIDPYDPNPIYCTFK